MDKLNDMRQEFWNYVTEQGKVYYDFDMPEHRAVYYAEMGLTREQAKKDFPALFNFIENERPAPSPRAEADFNDAFACQMTGLGLSQGVHAQYGNSYVQPMRVISMSMALYDQKNLKMPLWVGNPYESNVHALTAICDYVPPVISDRPVDYRLAVTHSAVGMDGRYVAAAATAGKHSAIANADTVHSIDIGDPIKNKSPKSNPCCIICYGRTATPTEAADHSYTNVSVPSKPKEISIHMPYTGILTVGDNVTITGIRKNEFQLYVEVKVEGQGGSIDFSLDGRDLSKIFTIAKDKKSISWNFERDGYVNWNNKLKTEKVYNNMVIQFRSLLPLTGIYEDGETKHPVNINGHVESAQPLPPYSGGPNRYIPEILLWWGCFEKTARIKMADGGEKSVADIRPGDLVATANQGNLPVRQIYSGHEEELVRLETAGGLGLGLTDSHPVMTGRGAVRARELNAGDQIITRDGPQALVSLYSVGYRDTVYNLAFDEPCEIYANGLLVGDFARQQERGKPQRRQMPDKAASAPAAEELLGLAQRGQLQRWRNSANSGLGFNYPARPLAACACNYPPAGRQGNVSVRLGGHGERPANDFTLEAWVNIQGQAESLVEQPDGFSFGIRDGEIIFHHPKAGELHAPAGKITLGQWTHLFATYDNRELAIGVNGVETTRFPLPETPLVADADLILGKKFSGLLRRVALYERALSPAEIRRRMFQNTCPDDGQVEAWIDFTSVRPSDRGPWNLNLRLAPGCNMVSAATCLRPAGDRMLRLDDTGVNPGGFESGSFGLYGKLYTLPEESLEAALFANGQDGDQDDWVVVARLNPESGGRDLYFRHGDGELELARNLPGYQWIDLALSYEASESSLTCFVNGQETSRQNLSLPTRRQAGECAIGGPYAWSCLAVFDTPLWPETVQDLFLNQPFIFEPGLRALLAFEAGQATELVSNRVLPLEKDDLTLMTERTDVVTRQRYLYNPGAEGLIDPLAEQIYRWLAEFYRSSFGLEIANRNRETDLAVCRCLSRLLERPGMADLYKKGETDEDMLRLLCEAGASGLFPLAAVSYANSSADRAASDAADRAGMNSLAASTGAMLDCLQRMVAGDEDFPERCRGK